MASADYVFIRRWLPMRVAGLPHSEISGSKPVDGSPKLVAVFRVLHRLLMPRHPSCARIRLARNIVYIRITRLNLVCVAILFNLQLPVFKDRLFVCRPSGTLAPSPATPFRANGGILYHISPAPRKGVFLVFLRPRTGGGENGRRGGVVGHIPPVTDVPW